MKFWTNPSVLQLAGDRDPVEVVTERARDLVFRAVEEGWEGPPFDPFALAGLMQIDVVPRENLYDARVVSGAAGATIEFNPTRPRGRVRFSVAHELAHTFFPDFEETTRYRSSPTAAPSDEWQLELLCNIAASELLMPVGSFTDLKHEPLEIERLMELRKSFDVSTEALLLRVAKLTDVPSAFFAAARFEGDRIDSGFRVDYIVGSRNWSQQLKAGMKLPADSVLGECTAVGYTAKRNETWAAITEDMRVECVGIAPYPGQKLPRVVGFVMPQVAAAAEQGITEVLGDARYPRGSGPHMIVHLVNDKTANWGGAFARALKERWPNAQDSFKEWADRDRNLALGNVHFIEVEPHVTIATMIAQKGYGPSVTPRVRYGALRECLTRVAEMADHAVVHMPRIGAGQAGGDWRIIRELIGEALTRRGIEVTVYTLPGTSVREPDQMRLAVA